ncbi:MAG: hypothetical protein H6912_05885 [Kordiimonadaceae bacterium]|nr:hypothetical protein [Kordiimonadaceae bacterium]
MIKFFLTAILSISIYTFSANSQQIRNDPIIFDPDPDSPILSRNPELTGEGEAFDFLIGDWDVVITWDTEDRPSDTYRAKWHNHWIINGYAVMQEWRGPDVTGSEFRFYDMSSKSWKGRNIYQGGAWRETVAHSDGDKMIVTIFAHNNQKGDFLNRETYFNIKNDSFEMKSDLSYDNGKSWQKGAYQMIVTRSVEK